MPCTAGCLYLARDSTESLDVRAKKVLKPGLWQEWLTDKIWTTTRLKCAFNFRNHSLNNDATAGKIKGTCKCKSMLRCEIDASDENVVRIECCVNEGTGICGRRPLRAPIRHGIGEKLCTESAALYRAERADELMQQGDTEPPHLYKPSALHNAKHEFIAKQYLHKDPVRALEIMQLNSMANVIHNIGLNPFKIHYWTNHQLHIYRAYSRKEKACVYLDATGGIVKPIIRCDGTKSKCIFLYIAVINHNGQFSVAQMISERHDTQTIMTWLTEWEKFGAPTPKEVVCDSSKALLGAAIRAFTGYASVEEYANACDSATLPACYVRIDVAHFIKMYAGILKSSPNRVRVFYLAVLGQLILSRNMNDATKLLKSFFIVSLSETEGVLPTGERTQCEIHKHELKGLLDPSAVATDEERSMPIKEEISESIFNSSKGSTSKWWNWAKEVEDVAKNIVINEEGDRVNAHYMPSLASRLLDDLRWFPLWSSICRDRFSYGRVPASSASVESEFNYIKSHLLKNCPKPMRVDSFIEKHVRNLTGRLKIAAAPEAAIEGSDSSASDILNEEITNQENEYSLSELPANDVSTREFSPKGLGISIDVCPGQFQITEDTVLNDSEHCHEYGHIEYSIVCSTPMEATPELLKKNGPKPRDARSSIERFSGQIGVKNSQTMSNLVDLTVDSPQVSKRENEAQTCVLCAVDFPQCQSVDRSKNLCAECMSIENVEKILSAREVENWRGLASNEVRKRSRYLTRNYATFDAIFHGKLTKIPIMRNASSLKLQATKFGTVNYSFSNTCGFDSVMQVLLVAACDKPYFSEVVNAQMTENPLFHLIFYIMSKGLTAHAYWLRAKMLRDLFQVDNSRSTKTDCYVNCEVNVSYLVTMLFAGIPSIEEKSVCNKGCVPRKKYISVPSIKKATLTESSFSDVLTNHVALKGLRRCCVKNCSGVETTTFSKSGPFVFIEIEDIQNIELSTIPLQFCDPMEKGKSFELLGVIDLKAPMKYTRLSGDKCQKMEKLPMGHYTAVCLRPPTSWMEYDDQGKKVKKLSKHFQVYPGLLIYAKKNEAMKA